ncbi:MAG TPA: hypothetical protein DCL73_12605 [Treponema sp.]|nr:hypothetical protein [Treponema sp.]
MPLLVVTKKNNLKTSETKAPYLFLSREAGKYTLGELMAQIVRDNPGVNRFALGTCIDALMRTTSLLLSKGYRVEFPFVDLYVKASGAAKNTEMPFTPSRKKAGHAFRLHAHVRSRECKDIVSKVEWHHDAGSVPGAMPVIKTVSYSSPEHILIIRGRNLDFTRTGSGGGVHVTLPERCSPVYPEQYVSVRNSEIIAVMPELPCGMHNLYVESHGHTRMSPFYVQPSVTEKNGTDKKACGTVLCDSEDSEV